MFDKLYCYFFHKKILREVNEFLDSDNSLIPEAENKLLYTQYSQDLILLGFNGYAEIECDLLLLDLCSKLRIPSPYRWSRDSNHVDGKYFVFPPIGKVNDTL